VGGQHDVHSRADLLRSFAVPGVAIACCRGKKMSRRDYPRWHGHCVRELKEAHNGSISTERDERMAIIRHKFREGSHLKANITCRAAVSGRADLRTSLC
jgi:hypothetical protein